MSAKEVMDGWDADCLKWRGRVLAGKHSHWCYDWDMLPVDETTPEWPCNCAAGVDGEVIPRGNKGPQATE